MRRLLTIAALFVSASTCVGQTDTATFAAELFRYRVEPNIVYHTVNNYQNKLDVYRPEDAT